MQPNLRALIVENNPVDQMMLSSALHRAFVAADTVGSFNEAERKLREEAYDIFFVDLKLPAKDGFSVIDMIRKLGPYLETPIIVTSGLRQQEDVRKAIRAGATDYVVKPLDLGVLEQKLDHHFFKGQVASEWYLYPVANTDTRVYGQTHVSVVLLRLNELGMELQISGRFQVGDLIEVRLPLLEGFGVRSRLVRIDREVGQSDPPVYHVSFQGMEEKERKLIRLECRKFGKVQG